MNTREFDLVRSEYPHVSIITDATRDQLVDYFSTIVWEISELLICSTSSSGTWDEAAIGHFFRNATTSIVALWKEDPEYRDRETMTLHKIYSALTTLSLEQKTQLKTYLTDLHNQWNDEASSTLLQEHGTRLQVIYKYMKNDLIWWA